MRTVPRCCEICGSPLRRSNLAGICSTNKECLRVKMERARHPDGKPPVNTEPPCGPGETWKPAPDPYGSLYLVSNRGRIWSMHRHRGLLGGLLKPWIHGTCKAPKLAVTLYDGETKWPVDVHVLVMLVFAGPCPEGLEVRHLDGDAYRNWWEPGDEAETRARGGNLIYGSHAENCADASRHGTAGCGLHGTEHPRAKLTEEIVRRARSEYVPGAVTDSDLAARYGVDKSTLYKARVGLTWKHVV